MALGLRNAFLAALTVTTVALAWDPALSQQCSTESGPVSPERFYQCCCARCDCGAVGECDANCRRGQEQLQFIQAQENARSQLNQAPMSPAQQAPMPTYAPRRN